MSTSELWHQPVWVWAASALAMTLGWMVQRRTRNAGVVDAIWTAGLGGSALYYAASGEGLPDRRLAVALFGSLWAARLGWHLGLRILGEVEDGRYRHLRRHWHDNQVKFFLFFQAQAWLVALFSLPLLAAAANRAPWSGWDSLGIAVWLLAIGGESLADRQLARFRADPAHHGLTCREGLWRYSRHPNYFFEWLQWFAYLLLAVGSMLWWLALLGPVLMLVSLYWVTGIPFTEAQALRSRGEDYRDYQRRTSPFFPWFPKDPRHDR